MLLLLFFRLHFSFSQFFFLLCAFIRNITEKICLNAQLHLVHFEIIKIVKCTDKEENGKKEPMWPASCTQSPVYQFALLSIIIWIKIIHLLGGFILYHSTLFHSHIFLLLCLSCSALVVHHKRPFKVSPNVWGITNSTKYITIPTPKQYNTSI